MRALLAASLILLPLAAHAQSQSSCGPRDQLISMLLNDYRESPVEVGVTYGGQVLELLTSPEGETWTMIVSRPNGISCLFATGNAWMKAEPDKEPQPKGRGA